jgi:hypothetical protein
VKSPRRLVEAGDNSVIDEDVIGVAGRKSNPMTEALLNYEVLSPEEVAIFTARAAQWRENVALFEDWQLDRLFIYIQILDKLATSPPPGRGSGSLVIQAIKDVREQSLAMSNSLAEAREAKRHQAPTSTKKRM